jgi:pimeloyl-ACP methyl ester carboxylesterase
MGIFFPKLPLEPVFYWLFGIYSSSLKEDQVVEKKINYSGHDFHYYEYGSGEPVILIHGFAEDAEIWKSQVASLQNKFRLLVPDIPGSGRSPYNNNLVSIEDFSETIKLILDTEQIQKMVLIGHSMGGYIALAFAEKYAERLLGLGLFHSTAYADTEEKKAARKKSIDFIKEHGAAEFIKSTIPNLFSANFNANHANRVKEMIEKYSYFSPEALIVYYEAMIKRPDRHVLLKDLRKPILFIIGEEDKAVPVQDSLEQTHIPDLAFIHFLRNTAHLGMLEHPDLTSSWMNSFIDACNNPTF